MPFTACKFKSTYLPLFQCISIIRLLLKNIDHKQIIFKLSYYLFQGHGMNLSFVGRISVVLPSVFDSKLFFFCVQSFTTLRIYQHKVMKLAEFLSLVFTFLCIHSRLSLVIICSHILYLTCIKTCAYTLA